jgi:DASS family divalent anion:Na+ symporter
MSQVTAAYPTPKSRKYWHWFENSRAIPVLSFLAVFLFLWNMDAPTGLSTQAWNLFTIFVVTLASIVANLLPMGAIAVISLTLCAATKTLPLHTVLSGFTSHVVWLIFAACLLARGFIQSGLGARIGYYFIYMFGKSMLGISYALVTAELLLAPFIPSNTARGAGIIFPIANSLLNQEQLKTKKIGGYLMQLCFQANTITSAMFLTAMAANPLISDIIRQAYNIEITWLFWAKAAIVPGIINLLLIPPIFYFVYKPGAEKTPEAPVFAKKQLEEMGPLKLQEWIMLATFGLLLVLWTMGSQLGIDPTTAALVGLSILLVTRVLSWNDILKEHQAWNTFIWLAILLMMSSGLNSLGMMTWFGAHIEGMVSNLDWVFTLGIVAVLYYYTHYLFASMTAHVTSLFGVFAIVATSAGAPVLLTVLMMSAFSSLCGSLTHYGTGTAPIYFDTGHMNLQKWWKAGFLFSVLNITIWAISGSLWWKILGLW